MLIDEPAGPGAFMRRIAVMRTVVLSPIDAEEAAFRALYPAKDQPTFQFLGQPLELPIEQLDFSVLPISFSILLEPSPDLMDPCIRKGLKVLVKGS